MGKDFYKFHICFVFCGLYFILQVIKFVFFSIKSNLRGWGFENKKHIKIFSWQWFEVNPYSIFHISFRFGIRVSLNNFALFWICCVIVIHLDHLFVFFMLCLMLNIILSDIRCVVIDEVTLLGVVMGTKDLESSTLQPFETLSESL